jgi:hypothetical protein
MGLNQVIIQVIGVFLLLAVISSYFTWKGMISLLPLLSITASTIGYWTNSAKYIRLSNLMIGSPSWLIYDAIVGSAGGVISEAITQASIILSIIRFGWKALDEM